MADRAMLVADKSEVLDLYRGAIRAGQAPTLAEASALLRFHEGDPMWSVAGPYRTEVVRELGFGLPCHEAIRAIVDIGSPVLEVAAGSRSEEHTSELQSLMRISYAVFCLKKKKHIK